MNKFEIDIDIERIKTDALTYAMKLANENITSTVSTTINAAFGSGGYFGEKPGVAYQW